MRSISINCFRFVPRPRAIRWDYRSGTHYWLTQWRAWMWSAIVLVLALVDLAVDGTPLDHSWAMWAVWFISGLLGTFLPFVTWRFWIGPVIAQRRARAEEVRSQIAALDEQLTDPKLEPWARRKLELQREMHAEELSGMAAKRTTIPAPVRR